MSDSFSKPLVASIQATISVLLIISYGYLSSKFKLLDSNSLHKTSAMCTKVFLPALYLKQVGPELSIKGIEDLWQLLVYAFVSISLALLLGWLVGHKMFRFPYWVVAASGFCNANALPFLLISSLETTGSLDDLVGWGGKDETVSQAVNRAKSYILLNSFIQQMMAFSIGYSILEHDKTPEHYSYPFDKVNPDQKEITDSTHEENVGLLEDDENSQEPESLEQGERLDSQFVKGRKAVKSRFLRVYGFVKKTSTFIASYLNPPLVGALLALIIGLIPPFHEAFLDKNGIFYGSVTNSVDNLGQLYVAFQTYILGCQLANKISEKPSNEEQKSDKEKWKTRFAMIFVILVRFVIMPALSILFVQATAGKGWYRPDKMLYLVLMLAPMGPCAIILAAMAELAGVDESVTADLLTLNYLVAPFMAIPVALSLHIVKGLPV